MSELPIKKGGICPVTFTMRALQEVKEILKHKNIPSDYYLRVATAGGGCAGVSYVIGFDKQKEKDEIFEMEGVHVLIEKKHAMFLWGVKVDFIETDAERGFNFINS